MAFKDKFNEFQPIRANDRFILRQVELEKDLDIYHRIYCDTDAFRYYEGANEKPPSRDTTIKILQNQIKAFEKQREYTWTIADIKSGKALGRIHLSDFQGGNKIANIGYFIGRDSWGKGIISACIAPVVAFGFSYLEFERIFTTVHVDNTASWKALERNGFTREGLLRHCFNIKEGLCNCYMYSKLSTD